MSHKIEKVEPSNWTAVFKDGNKTYTRSFSTDRSMTHAELSAEARKLEPNKLITVFKPDEHIAKGDHPMEGNFV